MKKKRYGINILLLVVIGLLVGCETGVNNIRTTNNASSGIITKGDSTSYKASTPKASEIEKIYSNSGTPGYYVQVGVFKKQKPNADFINRMQYAQLPYTLLKKYKDGNLYYHALVGPYVSYNKAKAIQTSAKEFVTTSAFVVNLVRP